MLPPLSMLFLQAPPMPVTPPGPGVSAWTYMLAGSTLMAVLGLLAWLLKRTVRKNDSTIERVEQKVKEKTREIENKLDMVEREAMENHQKQEGKIETLRDHIHEKNVRRRDLDNLHDQLDKLDREQERRFAAQEERFITIQQNITSTLATVARNLNAQASAQQQQHSQHQLSQ